MHLDTALSTQMHNCLCQEIIYFSSYHECAGHFNANSCHKNVQQASKDEGKEK
jgi:hypothetical protein